MVYDEECPICGTVNKGLNLAETNGWFICEKCENEVNNLTHFKTVKDPFLKTVKDGKKHCSIA